ncbi:NAD(P)-binding protein, partial [Myriangium duriaei CBS 260.36]
PGINLSFATLLLASSCNVILADLSLRPEAHSLLSTYPTTAHFVHTDVTSWPSLAATFDAAYSHFGDVHLVCPGAGVYEPPWSSFWHPPGTAASKDDAEGGKYASLDINLIHPIRMTQMALARWLAPPAGVEKVSPQNPKRVVHVASVAGLTASLCTPLYHASKFGVVGFVRSLAALESIGVRVNGVAPGLVWTPLWAEGDKGTYADRERQEWVTAEEVARGMVALATEEEWKGGSVMEISRMGMRREVAPRGDPGPDSGDFVGFDGKGLAKGVLRDLGVEGWGV